MAVLNNSPPFVPHVTIVGGIELRTENDGNAGQMLLQELKNQFQSFSAADQTGIPCEFARSRSFVTGYNDENIMIWSQTCVGIVERNKRLVQAVELARKCLYESKYVNNMKDEASLVVSFGPPLNEPHLSFAYKTSELNEGSTKEVFGDNLPEDFISNEMVLVKTDPESVEGVPYWEVIGSFSI